MSASSASTLLCKVYLPDNEIRRLKISRSQASFANLKSLVLNYYNDAIPTGQFARLKYKDEEGEWVLADSDAELLDAFQENSIKIQLYFSSKQEAPQSIQLQPIPETYSKAPQIPHSPSGSSSSAFLPSPPITIPKQPMHAPTPFSSPQNIAPRIAPSFVPSPAQQQPSPFIPMQPQRPMSVPVPATGVPSPVPVRYLPPATPPPAAGGATSIPSMLPSPSPRPSPSPAPVLAPSPSPSPRPPAQQPSFLSKPKAIHVGYKCDSCGKLPIEGTRFTCKTCENYDLCEYCHRYRVNFHDASHQFIAHEQDEKEQPKTNNNNIFNPQQSIHQSLQLSNPNVQQQLQQQQQAASKRKQYEAQLKQLDEMGLLADEMKCLQLLDQHKGNVAPVIENLVSQM